MTGPDPVAPVPLGIIIGSMNRGGTETHLLDLLPALKQHGFAPSIYLIGADGPLREVFRARGIPVLPDRLREPPAGLPRPIRRLMRLFGLLPGLWTWGIRHRRGLLHAYLSEAVILSALALWPMRRRLLLAQRGLFTYRANYGATITSLERWAFRQSLAVTTNSGQLVEMLVEDGVPRDKIVMIPNGLSPERMHPAGADRAAARARLDLADDALVLVKVANLHVYKGHEDVLDALALLRAGGELPPRTVMLFIGSDAAVKGVDRRNQIEQRARDLGIADVVRCLGERNDATFLMRAADIGVHASHEEGSSNAVIEMMAAGLPIVATDVGGTSEALAEGAAGCLVPPRAPAELAAALRTVIADPRLRATLGEAARQRAQTEYTLAQCVGRHARLYRDMLKA
ncbi:glycosyltransferase [Roseomonas sp. PWR1]|uniref:Glycosyltransferase n=1 Tax=Roseomonas nitratireducens TaxID=2820810 RepID=A0ABS4AMX7_9PROT|nr:glycosyltransferase [Neoroseomonas nitratireducens]